MVTQEANSNESKLILHANIQFDTLFGMIITERSGAPPTPHECNNDLIIKWRLLRM